MTPARQTEVHEASGWINDAVVALGRALRTEGLCTTVDQELALSRALASIDIDDREQVRWAARACFLRGPHEGPAFERVFDRWSDGRAWRDGSANARAAAWR